MSASIFEQVDEIVAEAAAPARRHIATRALGWLSEVADQPQLISICAGTVLIGLAGRNRRLMGAGARMFLAELLDTGMKSAGSTMSTARDPASWMTGVHTRCMEATATRVH